MVAAMTADARKEAERQAHIDAALTRLALESAHIERARCIKAVEAILPYQVGDLASRSLADLRNDEDLLMLLNDEMAAVKANIKRRIEEGA